MKNELIDLMKRQIHTIADNLSIQNYKEMENEFYRIFTIIESAVQMMEMEEAIKKEEADSTETNEEQEANKFSEEIPKTIANVYVDEKDDDSPENLLNEEDRLYRFERKIKGGVVYLDGKEAFVPEKKIRELNLEHGDLVSAKFLCSSDNGPDRYEYELVEKSNEQHPEIVSVHMGVVSYVPKLGSYGIEKTVNHDEIVFEGEKVILKVTEEDAYSMKLSEGDIVDAAFYKNNPDYVRIRWKYAVDEVSEESSSPKPSSYYKKKNQSEQKEVDQTLQDKTICVIGYEPGHASFREEVEKRGGSLIGMNGREGVDSLESALKKSDGVVMVIGHVGHAATIFTVDFCKKNEIPYTDIKTFGRSTFIKAAESLVQN